MKNRLSSHLLLLLGLAVFEIVGYAAIHPYRAGSLTRDVGVEDRVPFLAFTDLAEELRADIGMVQGHVSRRDQRA